MKIAKQNDVTRTRNWDPGVLNRLYYLYSDSVSACVVCVFYHMPAISTKHSS
jgi:hypothetical protein